MNEAGIVKSARLMIRNVINREGECSSGSKQDPYPFTADSSKEADKVKNCVQPSLLTIEYAKDVEEINMNPEINKELLGYFQEIDFSISDHLSRLQSLVQLERLDHCDPIKSLFWEDGVKNIQPPRRQSLPVSLASRSIVDFDQLEQKSLNQKFCQESYEESCEKQKETITQQEFLEIQKTHKEETSVLIQRIESLEAEYEEVIQDAQLVMDENNELVYEINSLQQKEACHQASIRELKSERDDLLEELQASRNGHQSMVVVSGSSPAPVNARSACKKVLRKSPHSESQLLGSNSYHGYRHNHNHGNSNGSNNKQDDYNSIYNSSNAVDSNENMNHRRFTIPHTSGWDQVHHLPQDLNLSLDLNMNLEVGEGSETKEETADDLILSWDKSRMNSDREETFMMAVIELEVKMILQRNKFQKEMDEIQRETSRLRQDKSRLEDELETLGPMRAFFASRYLCCDCKHSYKDFVLARKEAAKLGRFHAATHVNGNGHGHCNKSLPKALKSWMKSKKILLHPTNKEKELDIKSIDEQVEGGQEEQQQEQPVNKQQFEETKQEEKKEEETVTYKSSASTSNDPKGGLETKVRDFQRLLSLLPVGPSDASLELSSSVGTGFDDVIQRSLAVTNPNIREILAPSQSELNRRQSKELGQNKPIPSYILMPTSDLTPVVPAEKKAVELFPRRSVFRRHSVICRPANSTMDLDYQAELILSKYQNAEENKRNTNLDENEKQSENKSESNDQDDRTEQLEKDEDEQEYIKSPCSVNRMDKKKYKPVNLADLQKFALCYTAQRRHQASHVVRRRDSLQSLDAGPGSDD